MKKLIILFTFFSVFSYAQIENFSINNRVLQWQKIYNTEHEPTKLIEIIKSNSKIKIENISENSINGTFENFTMDYKGAGSNYMTTSLYLNEFNTYTGKFKIDFKEGKYRVTIDNVSFKGTNIEISGISSNEIKLLEIYAMNSKNEFRQRFKTVDSKIIDYSFSNLFDISKYKIENSDW